MNKINYGKLRKQRRKTKQQRIHVVSIPYSLLSFYNRTVVNDILSKPIFHRKLVNGKMLYSVNKGDLTTHVLARIWMLHQQLYMCPAGICLHVTDSMVADCQRVVHSTQSAIRRFEQFLVYRMLNEHLTKDPKTTYQYVFDARWGGRRPHFIRTERKEGSPFLPIRKYRHRDPISKVKHDILKTQEETEETK